MRLSEMIYTEEELQQEIRAKESWRDLYREQLEKNKKLKADYIKLSKIVEINGGYRASYVNELRDKITMLEEENRKLKERIEKLEKDLEHRDSFFSIMRDVLANEYIDYYELATILDCVVHYECGDADLSKKELEIVNNFWGRKYC